MSSFTVDVEIQDATSKAPTTTKRPPRSGISVLIVGAGPVGVYTALECWRKGHDVRIIERNPSASTQGDFFTIAPQIGKHIETFWPDMKEENDVNACDPWISWHHMDGSLISGPEPFDFGRSKDTKDVPDRMHRHLRPKFLGMLLSQLRRVGIEVEYGLRVVKYYENERAGGVILSDGQEIEADVVVASDGIGTKSHEVISGHEIRAWSSGWAIARTAYPAEAIAADLELEGRFKKLDNGHHVIEMWLSREMMFSVLRTDDMISWILQHKDKGTAAESWHNSITADKVLEMFSAVPNFPDYAKRLIKSTPEGGIIDWPLMWRNPQPITASPLGHVIQAGDAAHTFLPSSGSGVNQGIEDGIYLATCLQLAGKANIAWGMKVCNKLRFERVSCSQKLGIINQHRRTNMAATPDDQKPIKQEYGRWIWAHDVERYVYDSYTSALDHLQTGGSTPFHNTNIPPGYVHQDWSVDKMMADVEQGKDVNLGGDWS